MNLFEAEVTLDKDGRLQIYFEDWLHGTDLLIYLQPDGRAVRFDAAIEPNGQEVPFDLYTGLVAYLQQRQKEIDAFDAEREERRRLSKRKP